jgi:hypothetical protein
MADMVNVEKASSRGFLWPPIADAVDTFLRRRLYDADPYERIWRLIHVWEATEITLAVAAIARIREADGQPEIFRRIREYFYGQTWDQINRTFRASQGAAEGSIDQWINILDELAKCDAPPGSFLVALRDFLGMGGINLTNLATQWARACDVPDDVLKGDFKVRQAMRHINSLRNRLAHVPFPHDPLPQLADALETATEQLFSVAPLPASHAQEFKIETADRSEQVQKSSPLTGAIRVNRCFIHGGVFEATIEDIGPHLLFSFPCKRGMADGESWSAELFIHLDSMMRPHLLTRVRGFEVCEYTRFRAEANAVFIKTSANFSERVPRPTASDYPSEREESTTVLSTPAAAEMSSAVEAMRLENYDQAFNYLEQVVLQRPEYHVGWLRLGHARREKAVRIAKSDIDGALQLLASAAQDLQKAANHIDPDYKALARYERSKALYHIGRLQPTNVEAQRECEDEALQAFTLSGEQRFRTWFEHVEKFAPWKLAETANAPAVETQQRITKADNDLQEGTLTLRVLRPALIITGTGRISPAMETPPRISATLTDQPASAGGIRLSVGTGTTFDFHVHVKSMDYGVALKPGIYVIDYLLMKPTETSSLQ